MPEFVIYVLCLCLFIVVCVLLFKLHTMRRALKEICDGLNEKLDTDTNTLISISSLDCCSRKIASDLNKEIIRLRKEQHKYENRNNDIKVAVTNIAHDIRTPLTAINGYLELFEKSELKSEEKRWLSIIRERTDNLSELTDELFAYSLAYSEAENMHLEEICINEELANILAGFYAALKSNNIEPEIMITEEMIYRRLDKKAFGRIINNLLSNVLKYSSGDLKISLDNNGVIQILNKADKLTSNDVAKLFDRFYTVRTAKGSTGLGLSIARMLTEKLNGEIEAYLENNYLVIKLYW